MRLKKTRKSSNPVPQLIDNKRKHLERHLSLAQRDQLLMNELKEEALFRKDLTDGIRESNETFARSNLQKGCAIFDNFHQNYFFGFAYYC